MRESLTPILFRSNSIQDMVAQLLPLFERSLDKTPQTRAFDVVRQSIILMMGSLAGHLQTSDPKVRPILGKLIQALSTPSEQVSDCQAQTENHGVVVRARPLLIGRACVRRSLSPCDRYKQPWPTVCRR